MMAEINLTTGNIVQLVVLVCIVLQWLMLVYLPGWTRPDIYFGVTVRPEFRKSEQGKQALRRYRLHITLHSLIGVAILAGSLFESSLGRIFALALVGLSWQLAGLVFAMIAARKCVLPFAATPTTAREACLEPRQHTLPGGWFWVGPLVILAVFAAYLGLRWNDMPARIPTHWGISGMPDAWADRNVSSVFATIALGLTCWLVMIALSAGLPRLSRRIASRGISAEQEQRFMRIGQQFLLVCAYWMAFLTGSMGLLPLYPGPNSSLPTWFYWTIASEAVMLLVIIVVLVRTGQGGWRLKPSSAVGADSAASASAEPIGDRTPDSAWKLGLLYYNPKDPAVIVEKRFGIGWSLNWGRPATWLLLLAVTILTAAVPIALVFFAQSTEGASNRNVAGPGKQFVELLAKDDFDGAVARFDTTMKRVLPNNELRETWQSVEAQVGPYQKQLGTRQTKIAGYDVAFVTCQFERAAVDVKVVFDSQGLVTGLFFLPAQSATRSSDRSSQRKDKHDEKASLRHRDSAGGRRPRTIDNTAQV